MTNSTYSPGLEGIVAGETAISTLKGGLEFRGYRIEELADHATYEEVAHLLLHGELPNASQLGEFHARLADQAELPEAVIATLRRLPSGVSMMDVMRTAASMLALWDVDTADNGTSANRRKAERLLVKLPIVLAAAHRLRAGKEPVMPQRGLSVAGNLLYMLTRTPPPAPWERAMDVSLILYAELEYNASTFTARVVSSTLSDLHSAVTAAIGALKGPLHGGANERVLEVLQRVGSADRAEGWIRNALADKQRIMGFGHRVYKQCDPRAAYLKRWCVELAKTAACQDMEEMAEVIERIVWEEKKLPPNVDWPSARLYHYMSLPVDLYTPLFVVSRVAGWSAHVIEQLENNRLFRPAANYTGPPTRAFVPLEQR